MPSSVEYQIINKQLIRAATSVAANTRASFKSRSKKEYVAKLGVVIEEADESLFWLELLKEINNNQEILKCIIEAESILKIFSSLKTKYSTL